MAGHCGRNVIGGAVIGLGTAGTACVTAFVAVAAVWLAAGALSDKPVSHAKPSVGSVPVGLFDPYPTLAGAGGFSDLARIFARPVYARRFETASYGPAPGSTFAPRIHAGDEIAAGPPVTHVAELTPAVTPESAPTGALPLPLSRPQTGANGVPLPRSNPLPKPPAQAEHKIARALGTTKTCPQLQRQPRRQRPPSWRACTRQRRQ